MDFRSLEPAWMIEAAFINSINVTGSTVWMNEAAFVNIIYIANDCAWLNEAACPRTASRRPPPVT